MVTFETLESSEVEFGKNDFIEVSRKKAIGDDGENIFLSLSRGFVMQDGEKRYKKNFSFPDNKKILEGIIKGLEALKE